eukprot:CAMPEP_0172617596 /NCGR_PEP_ID=MMETSP1068-20121228/70349_1 /TAXON_ID=35684 /ORGANISM="Pseudopedinella elastica, Strain CCMP716" /LENGTH=216 /DNA_ID=CAMNT_0013423385 /DNA_START=80 /DNA_END=730 /DNA_ORIENTATION=+
MPRSRREKKVPLTQVKKKDSTAKSDLVDRVREAVDSYAAIYALGFQELRSTQLQAIRVEFRDSRLFFGKNKIVQLALGKTSEDEYQDNLRRLSELMSGNIGLLATNRSHQDFVSWFNNFEVEDYAKQGFVPGSDLVLEAGPLPQFPVSMCGVLRKLGLKLQIDVGKLVLLEDAVVCAKGKPLSAEQAKLTVHLGLKLVKFKAQVLAKWQGGSFEEY